MSRNQRLPCQPCEELQCSQCSIEMRLLLCRSQPSGCLLSTGSGIKKNLKRNEISQDDKKNNCGKLIQFLPLPFSVFISNLKQRLHTWAQQCLKVEKDHMSVRHEYLNFIIKSQNHSKQALPSLCTFLSKARINYLMIFNFVTSINPKGKFSTNQWLNHINKNINYQNSFNPITQ